MLFIFFRLSGLEAFENLTDNSEPNEIADALNTLEWTEEQINGFEENVYLSGNQFHFCFSDNKFVSSLNSKRNTEKISDLKIYYFRYMILEKFLSFLSITPLHVIFVTVL